MKFRFVIQSLTKLMNRRSWREKCRRFCEDLNAAEAIQGADSATKLGLILVEPRRRLGPTPEHLLSYIVPLI